MKAKRRGRLAAAFVVLDVAAAGREAMI